MYPQGGREWVNEDVRLTAEAQILVDEHWDAIRALAQAAELRVWDKPASACLSSRMEYGRRVTPEALRMIEQAEDALRGLGQ